MGQQAPKLTCRQARAIDLIGFLGGMGITPVKVRGDNFWYLSPLRNERHASFKISKRLNRWYDFGLGKGGNILDFGLLYFACSIPELLDLLGQNSYAYFQPQPAPAIVQGKILILSATELSHPALISYLRQRKINLSIASLYCCQIHYSNNGKTYFAIGFKNDSLGYELRSKYFKGSCSPKQITSICSGQSTAMVFEGFMDFLSFLSLPAGLSRFPADYFILNSVSLVKNVLQVLKSYRRIMTFLDNDAAGENCSQELQQRFKEKMLNLSYLFSPYKDLNDFLCSQAPSKEIPLQIPEPP